MGFRQIVFSGVNFKKTVSKKEIIAQSLDYDKYHKYMEEFLRALKHLQV